MSEICVVGSINMDVVTYVDVFPIKGQTMYGEKVREFPGGKGANQAMSCARHGKTITLIGAIGNDPYGNGLLQYLEDNHVDISHIKEKSAKTGQTTIIADKQGENSIILLQGANGELTPSDVTESIKSLSTCKVMLAQMETPYETVLAAMKAAKEQGMFVILDPAPADQVDDELMKHANLVLPNEHEAEMITGIKITDDVSATQAANIFKTKGVPNAILKVGSQGAYVFDGQYLSFVEGIKVNAIDAVGAGDSFAGAIASALIDHQSLKTAAQHANIFAALKVTKEGAQAGIPTLKEVIEFTK